MLHNCTLISPPPCSIKHAPAPPVRPPLPQVKERASKAQPVVRQAKILVDEERTNPDGTPRSKGIGFVEFTEHEHALCALRQLNNNPAAFSKVGRERGVGWRGGVVRG